ncbi:hypothetical protein CONLIGDRAFT_679354 [Coniochaeta ligniaria NRRL 30616]|uniref:Uncharacterized protein n=1 Tax=Coniochaeta ligniaria NRRL 30616 TaxID=1408157 RepID=A0A1J7ITC2_9PEZI|nr:hypothetical protein CONLIGDRAFT_679354 [Coniochaeta ligniaria NRRL 30616]
MTSPTATSRNNPSPGTSHSPGRSIPQLNTWRPLPPEPVRHRLPRDLPDLHHQNHQARTRVISTCTTASTSRSSKFPAWPTPIATPPAGEPPSPLVQPLDERAPRIPERAFQPVRAIA